MDSDELSASRQVCGACGIESPQTQTNYTLMSSRFGWRLSLEILPNGRRNAVWRCPKCWREFRNRSSNG